MRARGAIAAAVCVVLGLPATATAFDIQAELGNQARGDQRAQVYQQPGYVLRLQDESRRTQLEATQMAAADPERNFLTDVCNSKGLGCAGDVRLNDWESGGHGLVRRVLWTARNGSTVSGRVWATRAGPPKRPAIVITNGSIQASEELYWWAAQTLAKAGYVVVTFDPQMQGLSDTYGEGADRNEGVPSQTEGNTFYDWTQDAIDFLLSTPAKPYCPPPSRSNTSHCPKQQRRVKAGLDAGFNPFWKMVEGQRIGIAGHSYGASGVSWMGQQDKRVDAVVAWDNLCDPGLAPGGGTPLDGRGCSAGATGPPPGYRVPSLGLTADSFLGEGHQSDPDPLGKSGASRNFSKHGMDSGSIAIRGGTHFEFSFLPQQPFRATLRGIELATWYTRAWMDRYVKDDPAADKQLLTSRWRTDPEDKRVDPAGGGNLFSFYYRSRLDFHTFGGKRFDCEDLRSGCAGQTAADGGPANFSYLSTATTPDRASAPNTPSLVSLKSARVARGRLRVRASVNPAAAGRRVRIRFGRTSFTAKVPRSGRIVTAHRTRGRRGTVSVRLPAAGGVPAGSARARADSGRSGLRRTISLSDGVLKVAGRVNRRATGTVAVTVSWRYVDGRTGRLVRRVRIRRGRFAGTIATPFPVRFTGAQVSVAYAGSAKRHLRGGQLSRFVQP